MIAMFLFMAALFLFDLGLGRRWRWPALGLAASLIALFATRILFGP